MIGEPQQEHRWLDQLVGEWETEGRCDGGPGEPDLVMRGRESVCSLGGMWVVGSGDGEMPGGGRALTRITLGYDPQRGCYVGSWIGSMMHRMWLYEGHLDATGTVLTLDSEGPSMAGDGTLAKYQDIITIVGPDERTFTGQMQMPDGSWNRLMTANYRRVG